MPFFSYQQNIYLNLYGTLCGSGSSASWIGKVKESFGLDLNVAGEAGLFEHERCKVEYKLC